MLIPIIESAEDAEWISKAHAACGVIMFQNKNTWNSLSSFLNGGRKIIAGPFTDLDSTGECLNNGIWKIYVDADVVDVLAFSEAAYPAHRICVLVRSEKHLIEIANEGKFTEFHLIASKFDSNELIELAGRVLSTHKTCKLSIVLQCEIPSYIELESTIGKLHRLVKDRAVHVIAPIIQDSVTETPRLDILSPARSLLRTLAPSERADGLIPTVVADERGIALGFVYSSEESVIISVGSGRGVYWSRSRKKIWRKGESESGAIQILLSITSDCDQDCLKFSVVQLGEPPAFCHTGERSCWGEGQGISSLFKTLQNRKISAPPGSYTARLFANPEFLRNKLLEEASELMEAVQGVSTGTDTVQHVVEETADVLYFALTACVAGGASLIDVERRLDKKSLEVKRRPGDAKQYRIEQAAKLLKVVAETKKSEEV